MVDFSKPVQTREELLLNNRLIAIGLWDSEEEAKANTNYNETPSSRFLRTAKVEWEE